MSRRALESAIAFLKNSGERADVRYGTLPFCLDGIMQRIPLERAGEEMRLAKPVVNDNGITLIREGTVLTRPLIERLKNLGVRDIIVQGHPLEIEGEVEKPLSVLEKELEDRFRPTQSNPLMRELKEIFLKELRFWEEEKER